MGDARKFSRNGWLRLVGLGASVALMLNASETGAARRFAGLVVLGDSLSDTGNAGRYSDGPVWVEYLAESLGLPLEPSDSGGTNFAIGGARLDPDSGRASLPAQLERYLSDVPRSEGRVLHVVYGGGNDLLGALGSGNGDRGVRNAADAVAGIVERLVEAGATDILVPNLPDVGMTPAVGQYGQEAVREAARLSAAFNTAVDRHLAHLVDGRTAIYRLDIAAMAERVLDEPGAFGFRNVTGTCSGARSCEGYLFWDHLHPTTEAHRHLGEAAFDLLEQVRSGAVRPGATEPG